MNPTRESTNVSPEATDPKFITQAFIGGEFVDAATREVIDSVDPGTGKVIASVTACGEQDVDAAVRAAREAFSSGVWSRMQLDDRKEILRRFTDLVEAHLDELALLDSVDAGKPITDTRDLDLPDAVNTYRWYAEAIDKVFGRISPSAGSHLGLIQREPIGVVAAVLPWNFPMATLSWKLGPALAAGNSVVIKPAELTPFSTLRLAELAREAGIPAGVLNVVPGHGHVAGKALGLHPDVDVITFTGSTEVGRMFLRYAADSNLKKVVLECGGKSPQIVLADNADRLDQIADELTTAAFWNMGENCTAGSRILVHRSLHDELVAKLVDRATALRVGPPQDAETQIGPLVEEAHLTKVLGLVERGLAEGARCATGGRQVLHDSGGWFVEPTVLTDVAPSATVAQQEIFGPVVVVIDFDTEEEAINIANGTEYGLAASVFTRDLDAAFRVARAVQAGTVTVNCYGEGDISTPFGGYKTSGFGGHDKGLEAFDQYTELKTTWVSLNS
jgi:gamma-glutamyl-gamma-aminobutyraldehyde dehydrogenase